MYDKEIAVIQALMEVTHSKLMELRQSSGLNLDGLKKYTGKKKGQKAASKRKPKEVAADNVTPIKRKGRPAGSKNKPKAIESAKAA